MTDEPGIYFIPALIDDWKAKGHCKEFLNFEMLETYKDFGGIRIEDDILITKDGCRFLGTKRIALMATIALSASAAKKKAPAKDANKPVFTIIKENPITTIKDQNRSGTCWDYSTLSFFEAEILKATGKKYTLCEAFVANKTYMERAIQVVRYHGDCQFAQGGSAEDVLQTLKKYGICPIDAMPFPGSLYGDSLNNFNEFFGVLEPYVAAVAKSDAKKISKAWKTGMQGILDAYLGKCPEKFTYEGKEYTPKSFMASLGINLDDYVSITSYTHHPFYTAFAVEVQDNWRFPLSYNVPMDEMMQIIDNAINNGYTVAWGGDVSEDGFTRKGLAYAVDGKKTQSLQGNSEPSGQRYGQVVEDDCFKEA